MIVITLDCGHIAPTRELWRVGPEKWCPTCLQWRHVVEKKRV